jgi:hypothetical protein
MQVALKLIWSIHQLAMVFVGHHCSLDLVSSKSREFLYDGLLNDRQTVCISKTCFADCYVDGHARRPSMCTTYMGFVSYPQEQLALDLSSYMRAKLF